MGTCKALKGDEVLQIINAFTGRQKVRNQALFALGVSTGLRITELLCLTVGTVLNKQGQIVKEFSLSESLYKTVRETDPYDIRRQKKKSAVIDKLRNHLTKFGNSDLLEEFESTCVPKKRKTKGHTGKVIVNDFCIPYLTAHLIDMAKQGYQQANDFLFVTSSGKILDRKSYYKIIRAAAEKCGLDGVIGTHSMRKTCADRLLKYFNGCVSNGENIVPIEELKKNLRNETLEATIHYTKSLNKSHESRIQNIPII